MPQRARHSHREGIASQLAKVLSQTRVNVSLIVSFRGIDCVLSVPVRVPHSEPRQRSKPPKSTHTATRSATAGDPAVQALKKRLNGQPEWEALLAKAGEQVTDGLLRRWINAKGGVDEAAASFSKHIAWRIHLGRISEASIQSDLATGKVYCQGCDYQGRPVLVVWASRHIIGRSNLDDTKKLIVYSLDTAIAAANPSKNKLGQILCLFDLTGLGWANLDAKALQAVFEVLQEHYPEALSELWFLNAPFLFWGIWRVVSPFISPATKDKIQFVRGSQRREKLESAIPAEVLPVCYGGQAELVPIEQAAALQRASADTRKAQSGSALAKHSSGQLPGRMAGLRRCTIHILFTNGSFDRRMAGPWNFAKEHNPVWAARSVASGAKRAVLAVPRPGWPRGKTPQMPRALSMHVQRAWNKRPPMPRPNPRFQTRSEGGATHLAVIDMLAFYLLLGLCFAAAYAIFYRRVADFSDSELLSLLK